MEEKSIEKHEPTKEEVKSHLEGTVHQSLYDLEHNLLPNLGHSQAKRLLLGAMAYPMKDNAFSVELDGEDMVKAYSACKVVSDALVALGVEVVIETMVQNAIEANQSQSEKVEITEEAPKKRGKKKKEE